LYLSVIRVGDVTTRMHFLEVRYQFVGIQRLVSRTTPKPLHNDRPRDHQGDQYAHAQRELSHGIGRRKTHVARGRGTHSLAKRPFPVIMQLPYKPSSFALVWSFS